MDPCALLEKVINPCLTQTINKVRAWLVVGINEIHPLLIVLYPKVWLKEKAMLWREDKEMLYYEFTKNAFSVLSYKALSSQQAHPLCLCSPLQLLVSFQ